MGTLGPAPKGFNWCQTEGCRVQIRQGGYRWCARCRGAWGAARWADGTHGAETAEEKERRLRLGELGITEQDIAETRYETLPAEMGHEPAFVNYDADDAEKDYDDHE